MSRKPKATDVQILPPVEGEPTWPLTLPLEIAVFNMNPAEACRKYGITEEMFRAFEFDPRFQSELRAHAKEMKKPSDRFKAKGGVYSEAAIDALYRLFTSTGGGVPANVQADAAKTMIKIAGLDASENRAAQTPPLVINLNLA